MDVWNAFVECWAALYIGHTNNIRLGQEDAFAATPFKELKMLIV